MALRTPLMYTEMTPSAPSASSIGATVIAPRPVVASTVTGTYAPAPVYQNMDYPYHKDESCCDCSSCCNADCVDTCCKVIALQCICEALCNK